MSGTARRYQALEAMSPVVIAVLVDRRLIDAWPFEVTRRGLAFVRSAPRENVWRRALFGEDAVGMINNTGS
jgi:hypothetical protein